MSAADQTLAERLQVKAGESIAILGAGVGGGAGVGAGVGGSAGAGTPEEALRALLLPLPAASVELTPAQLENAQAVFMFPAATTRDLPESHAHELLRKELSAVLPRIGAARVVWVCYRKGGGPKSATNTLNRDVIARITLDFGWRAIGNRPVSDTWSALRVRPLKSDENPLVLRP